MRTRYYLAAAGAACAGLLGCFLARPAPITSVDVEQPRLSLAAPIPTPDAALVQTFQAGHGGLSSIEVLAVVYDGPAPSQLTLRLWDAGDSLVAETTQVALVHNQPVRLSFSPLSASAGQTYRLELAAPALGQATVWAYGLDGYPAGALHHGDVLLPGDLRFSTAYTYLWPDLLRDGAVALLRFAVLALPLWLVLFAPGLLVLDVLQPGLFTQTRWARWGGALGLSLAVLPLLWLWATSFGLTWSPTVLGVVYAVIGAFALRRWLTEVLRTALRKYGRVRAVTGPAGHSVPVLWAPLLPAQALGWHDAAMAAILLVGLTVRLLVVRELALPAWVDSPHHALIARLIDETGRVPASYQPLLPIDRFFYHFGVHVTLVAVSRFSALPAVDVILYAGQVLNGLMPLAVYALTFELTRRRPAALVAAFFVGLVSYFPGYYVTWGRYSQLAGLLVLAPALAAVWHGLRLPGEGSAWRAGLCAGLLGAGVLLAHYRVFTFFVVFCLVVMITWLRSRLQYRWLAAAVLAGALLSAPWGLRLAQVAVPYTLALPSQLASETGYNEFPLMYFQSSLEQGWINLALVFAVWGLVWRERVIWVTVVWALAVLGLLNGAPATWLVNNSAWAITLFLPGAVVLGWGLDRWSHRALTWLQAPPTPEAPSRLAWVPLVAASMLGLAAGGLAYAAVSGLRTQVAIVNPVTVLATRADRQMLDWIDRNTPEDAVFLVNGWKWLGGLWAASDGGGWILPYTGRRTTLPPVDYAYGEAALHAQVNDLATRAAAIQDADSPETLAFLQAAGVSHIYIGARGGHLTPEMFADSRHYQLLQTNGAAWVFAVNAPP